MRKGERKKERKKRTWVWGFDIQRHLKMKMKSTMGCLREKNGLHVCQKSSKISKNSSSHIRSFHQEAQLETCISNKHDDSFCNEATMQDIRSDETNCCEHLEEESIQDHTQTNCSSAIEVASSGDEDRNSCEYQSCNVSDFFISDMSVSSPPIERSSSSYGITEATCLPDYGCDESNIFFDDDYMILPFLEDSIDTCNKEEDDSRNSLEPVMVSEESSLYLAIHQLRSCNQEIEVNNYPEWDPAECLDPQMFVKNLPDLSEVERKTVTLALDLDETLVHSSLEHCDDADFTFSVYFDLKEHTVYVKQRPYLREFLERVSEMFQIVVFTASQSIYAKQLLDILDPDGKIISHRAYRDSCMFTDGIYTKDLTVLGVDLAKVAIIDNCPQVFQMQVNNGIPIKSWFNDPSDCALITLLPFLETLADAEDVRPIIAKRFGHMKIFNGFIVKCHSYRF
ncbi:unnamed protein product [Lactuca saligna]|uniref:FCP1 homology domain-containing protein n=1 Tax=Lactuca saligna TaxID=75948 RepID=A0AA36EE77_LACSI|nr:unnamed protein product [Lactuca saligna]